MGIVASFRRSFLSAVIFGVIFFAGMAAPGAALTVSGAEGPVRVSDLDDFSFDRFDVQFTLGRDAERRSTLEVVEQFDARFPDFDQNRGFIREIPQVYDGHTVEVAVRSVTDENGRPRPYSVSDEGEFLWVTMAVPEGQFVRGAQSYVIEYSVRDVTRYFDDTGVDEFYWDLNGTGWPQPFGEVSGSLTVSDELATALTGDASCYRGELGANTVCPIERSGNTLSVSERQLGPNENVTIAVAFAAGTFADAPEANYYERPSAQPPEPFAFSQSTRLGRFFTPGGVPLLLLAAPACVIGAIAMLIVAIASRKRKGSGRAIIAQYEPVPGLSAAVAAELVGERSRAMTASLLDFAVRGNVRMVHDAHARVYGVQALTSAGLSPVEIELYDSVFGADAPVGEMVWIDGRSTRLGDAAKSLSSRAKSEAERAGLLVSAPKAPIKWTVTLLVLALAFPVAHAIVTLNFMFMTVLVAVGVQVLVWSLIGIFALIARRPQLSEEGRLAYDHLMGLREYIRLAEADRLRMLQSASGAEVDAEQVVRVYERLLPYAVIFGYEREWQQELARFYRGSNPEWVAGDTFFSETLSLSALHSAVHSQPVTRTVSSVAGSGSGSSFSSFSGGSSGGGFSGGGGGGGGGRGI